MIPRRKLFGNPDRTSACISPDGRHLGYLAPRDGVLNVFVAPIDDVGAARPVTHDEGRGIRSFGFAQSSEHVLYVQDQNGDENWHVYSVALETGEIIDLTPGKNVAAHIQRGSHKRPYHAVIAINDRVPSMHDLYCIDVRSGERTLMQRNDAGYLGVLCDDDLRVRLALRMEGDGSTSWHRPDCDGSFVEVIRASQQDVITPIGFDSENRRIYMLDSRGRDTTALMLLDPETGEQEEVFATDASDVSTVSLHPTKRTLQAVSWMHARREWKIFDAEIEADLNRLHELDDGDLELVSSSLDNRKWIAVFRHDDRPAAFYLYDRDAREARFLFHDRAELEGAPLARMHPVVIKSRDGFDLVSYLTLPRKSAPAGEARPREPLPLALWVHGGPWQRDVWGFHPYHQLFADRGYAVLSVNFRGSTGFGKRFLNAGDKEWGAKMHDDLIDAVRWAVGQGIADPARVAITGGSYGGYSVLVGLTLTPEVFACGVDIVGPSNLVTLIESFPEYWAPYIALFQTRVGNHRTEEGRAFLMSRSPITRVDEIRRPLLIAQGHNDPRVKRAESDQIVEAMRERGIPVTYVLYPGEGHGFAKPENSLSFMAITEAFLARHLGGACEPVGDAFEGSDFQILAGGDDIPPRAIREMGSSRDS